MLQRPDEIPVLAPVVGADESCQRLGLLLVHRDVTAATTVFFFEAIINIDSFRVTLFVSNDFILDHAFEGGEVRRPGVVRFAFYFFDNDKLVLLKGSVFHRQSSFCFRRNPSS